MTKKTRKISIFTVGIAVLIALFAVGCGSSSDDDTTADSTFTFKTPPTRDLNNAYTYQELYDEFQADFDRSHPFLGLDSFCKPHEDPSEELVATDVGISATEISIVQIRSQLEQFASIGFATDVGVVNDMFDAFIQVVNEECGGVYGRQIKLTNIEVPVTGDGVDDARNAACIQATEDLDAVFVLNSTGFQGSAGLCLAQRTFFISTQGQTQEYVQEGDGNMIVLSPTLEESLEYLAAALIASGELEGKTIAIVSPDTPGQAESARSLETRLKDAGLNVPIFDIIGCLGGTSCGEGRSESVSRLLDEDVDVLFPLLNVVSLPGYLAEMVTQGFESGDIAFYNSDFNSQAGDLVTSKVVVFGQAPAGNLYNNAFIIDDARTGAFREPGFTETAFNKMCADLYERISGVRHDLYDADDNSPYGMVSTVCAEIRIALRALYDAGPNPTRADIKMHLNNLGAIDMNNMLPASIYKDKYSVPDAVHEMQFTYPCSVPGTGTDQDTCVVAFDDEWRWIN